jgi:hypothetical protein
MKDLGQFVHHLFFITSAVKLDATAANAPIAANIGGMQAWRVFYDG